MKRRGAIGIAALVFGILPWSAFAQEQPEIQVEIEEPTEPRIVFEAGGGVLTYTQGLDAVTEAGGAWNVRGTWRIAEPFAIEASYLGGVNDLETLAGEEAVLMTNAGDLMVRAELPVTFPQGQDIKVSPFVAAGIGFENHRIAGPDREQVADRYTDSNDLAIPAAIGVQAYVGDRLTVSARGTYRFIPDDDVRVDDPNRTAQSFAATGNLGVTF